MADIHKLYGDAFSYYSGKARAYLRYKRLAFDEVTPSPRVFREIIIPRTGVHYIPVVITPDDIAVQDTTEIIDFLEARHPDRAVYPETPRQRLAALLLETYGDEWLLLPAMHYRWSYNLEFALSEFGRLAAPDAAPESRRKIGEGTAGRFRSSLPHLGITERTVPAIEAWYEEFLGHLNAHFERLPYLLGERPSIGDFGFFGPLYAHLYRDPASGALMKRLAPAVADWVERMNGGAPGTGNFLPDDQVPETLTPIFRRMFAEHVPVMLDTSRRLGAWLENNPGTDIPRSIGRHGFVIGGPGGDLADGVEEERDIFPYTQWMFQRSLDEYRSRAGAEKSALDEFLESVNGLAAMQTPLPCRVERVNNQLVAVKTPI